jgi:hypothetical protein
MVTVMESKKLLIAALTALLGMVVYGIVRLIMVMW